MIDIQEFADRLGVGRRYTDVVGKEVEISLQSRIAALGAMGYPIHDAEKLEQAALQEEREYYERILDPVQVIRDGDPHTIYIRTRADLSEDAKISWTLTFEDGKVLEETVPLYEIEIASYCTVQDVEYDTRRFFLPHELVWGYHSFKVKIVDGARHYEALMSLIKTPLTCYVPQEMLEGLKVWGVSVQLYALRSKNNWGVGDFHDLKDLLRAIARHGGHFVGLNPLHAGYPANPDPDMVSPYSPSSRQWHNIIYIRVEDIPEYATCEKASSLVSSKAFQQKLKALRDREFVDYRTVLELKLQVLRTLFDSLRLDDRRSHRGRKFLDFIEEGGESLLCMATYDALQASLYAKGKNAWGWTEFPKEYQQSGSPFVQSWRKEHLDDVRFYCYLQFIAQEQLEDAYEVAVKEKMLIGTYRDLAVGVAPGSCDVWADEKEIYRRKASVGAPPDPLGPLGQSWGLSPMDPKRLKEVAYKPLIDLYRSNMRSCGALRIDHAAGLSRLWWVPPENNPTDGAYVTYPMHDLLGIIALESQRNKCVVIAEDLGTIPNELRVALKEARTFSYKLFFGERAADGGYIAPQDYEPQAMSALTTHDMATLVGWWGDLDLSLGVKLGVYTETDAGRIGADRAICKQRILDSLHGLLSVGPEVPAFAQEIKNMTPQLQQGLQVHMCRGSCALFSSQLEDWIGVEKPVNIPGTFREYPNWRRKLTANVDEIFSLPYVIKLTAAMSDARKMASKDYYK